MALGTAYRPESVNVSEALDSLSEAINSMGHCDDIWILGDLNIDVSQSNTPKVQEFLSFCYQHGLNQIVKEPTRITDHTQTIIDLVMTDKPTICKNVNIFHNNCLSDHALVVVDVNIKKPKLKKHVKYQRALHNINFDKFSEDLKGISWDCFQTLDSVDKMVETFNLIILKLFDLHAPMYKTTVRDKPRPWITSMLKFMMTLRDNALKKANKHKTDSSKEYYRSLKNLVTATIEREKIAFFNHTINSNLKNPARLWRNIRNVTHNMHSQTTPIPDNLNDPDTINDHFLNLPSASTVSTVNSMNHIKPTEGDSLELKPTTEAEVGKIINNIRTKAAGKDSLNIEMIKMTLDTTLPIITKIINKSIESNTFPSCWKKALVKPIPKKDNVTELKDLRPISILPVLSKVLEKVVLSQVLEYVERKNIIPKFQSGFRRGHGTETALLHVTDDLTEASDMGLSSIMILLDYSRAFDCLDLGLLLKKLEKYGFSLNTCQWFQDYLTDREQVVVTENSDGTKKFSASKPVRSGVPQGSLLSPILFSTSLLCLTMTCLTT